MKQTVKKTKRKQCSDGNIIKIPKPSNKIETYLYIWAKGEGKIPEPTNREEMYLAYLASKNGGEGFEPTLLAPFSRKEVFYYAIAKGEIPEIKAISRHELFLQRIATGKNTLIPEPQNLQEYYLKYIAENKDIKETKKVEEEFL